MLVAKIKQKTQKLKHIKQENVLMSFLFGFSVGLNIGLIILMNV